jgi:hypothetical protein
MSNRKSAKGKIGSSVAFGDKQCRPSAPLLRSARSWPNAPCRMTKAALGAAIPCTVMLVETSVTTLALVESGLIIIGRALDQWTERRVSRGFARVAHCSFEGYMCIQ